MKVYCIDDTCPKRDKGYAFCTGLMSEDECPKVKARKEAEKEASYEADGEGDSNL